MKKSRIGLICILLTSLLQLEPVAEASVRGRYTTDVVIQEPVGEVHRKALADEVYRNLNKSRIQHLTINGSVVGNLDREQLHFDTIKDLPLTVLLALRLACRSAAPFSHWNVLLPELSGDLIPATIIRPDKLQLVINVGEPLPQPNAFRSPSEAELRRRYKIGPLGNYGRTWTSEERLSLDRALSALMLEERQFISNITFERRSHSGALGRGRHVADYYQRGGSAVIYLYDKAFEHDGVSYAGTPKTPYVNSVFGILHEIGHLIAAAPSLQSYRQAQELQRSYDGLYKDYETSYDLYLKAVQQLNAASTHREPLSANVNHTKAAAAAFEPQLELALNRTQAANRRGLRFQSSSPVATDYKRVRSNKKGPTAYGQTDLNESFAEAFAIFHLDPQALKWIDPSAYEWFRSGEHLRIIHQYMN